MVISKDKLQDIIDHLPQEVDVEEVVDRIVILAKIQLARQQIENGDFLTEEEMRKEMDSWQ